MNKKIIALIVVILLVVIIGCVVYFVNKNWPDFSEEDLLEAINEYQKRNRKFGGK